MADFTIGALLGPKPEDKWTEAGKMDEAKKNFLLELHERDREAAFTGRPICRRCAIEDWKRSSMILGFTMKEMKQGKIFSKEQIKDIVTIDWDKYYDYMELDPDDPVTVQELRIGPKGSIDTIPIRYAKFKCKNVQSRLPIHRKDIKLDKNTLIDPVARDKIIEDIDKLIAKKREGVINLRNMAVRRKEPESKMPDIFKRP